MTEQPDPYADLRRIEAALQRVEREGKRIGRWTPGAEAAAQRLRQQLTDAHRKRLAYHATPQAGEEPTA